MLRLILPGGRLASVQLRAVAQAASEMDRESVAITPAWALLLPDLPVVLLSPLTATGLSVQQALAGCPGSDVSATRDLDCVGVREQQPMLFTIGVPVLAGRLSLSQARKAADLAERYADSQLQITSRQQLLLLNVPKERVAQVLEGLESVDLRVAASIYRRGLTACAEGVEERARELLDHLEKQVPLKEPLRIHFSAGGCNCEQVLEAEIGLRAARGTCSLSVDGRPVPGADSIPAGLVKYRLENLLVRYKQDRTSGEPFREFCRRIGEEQLSHLLSGETEESRSR